GTDDRTGALGYWMRDADGELLAYSTAGRPVLPTHVTTAAAYKKLPPHERWESGRPISDWDKVAPLRTVAGPRLTLPDDFAGIWDDSARGGRSTVLAYPMDARVADDNVVLWVVDDQPGNTPVVYIHGDDPRTAVAFPVDDYVS